MSDSPTPSTLPDLAPLLERTARADSAPVRILMVCMGNICRSPTAHGVLETMAADAGLAGRIEVDSAGTHDYHVGEPPDERAHARRRGYDLSAQRARHPGPVNAMQGDRVASRRGWVQGPWA